MKSNKKGIMGLELLPALVGALVVGFVFLSVGGEVLGSVETNAITSTCIVDDGNANCSAAYNTSHGGLLGISEFSDFGSTMGLIGAAIVVLTLLALGLGRLTGSL